MSGGLAVLLVATAILSMVGVGAFYIVTRSPCTEALAL
jgi:hypothetical protein